MAYCMRYGNQPRSEVLSWTTRELMRMQKALQYWVDGEQGKG